MAQRLAQHALFPSPDPRSADIIPLFSGVCSDRGLAAAAAPPADDSDKHVPRPRTFKNNVIKRLSRATPSPLPSTPSPPVTHS